MNQKKEKASSDSVQPQLPQASAAASAAANNSSVEDVAFSMMHQKRSQLVHQMEADNSSSRGMTEAAAPAAAAASASAKASLDEEEAAHTDWSKLACLLCKRAFPSKEKLNK